MRFKKIARQIRDRIPILRDYPYFSCTWKPVCGFWKFAYHQIFPFFKDGIYFPYDKASTVKGNILVGKNCKVTQRGGCYIQGHGKIFIGDYVEITQNCILTSSNHSLTNQSINVKKEIIIGDHCWIGSNACIMGGVILGPRTVVGAGSVVTKSFPEGYCVIAGNPAHFIKTIPKEEFVPRHYETEFYGFIRSDKFPKYKNQYLKHLKFKYDLNRVTNNEELIRNSIDYDFIENNKENT